jgi:hypothetical protein
VIATCRFGVVLRSVDKCVEYDDAESSEQDLTKELAEKNDVRLLSSIAEWRSSSALGS